MAKRLDEAIQKNTKAKGLAVIIHNGYDNQYAHEEGCGTLEGTAKDGEAMVETFTALKFAIVEMRDAAKSHVEKMIKALVERLEYPDGYRSLVIYFAGHGDEQSILYGNDGEPFDLEQVIVQRLMDPKSDHLKKIPLLMFVDACRGDLSPLVGRMKREDLAPKNMMVAYSAREKFQALETSEGGIWTQLLASALKKNCEPVKDILEKVKANMPAKYKPEALPEPWNPKAGNICLLEDPDSGVGAPREQQHGPPQPQPQPQGGGNPHVDHAGMVNIIYGPVTGNVGGGSVGSNVGFGAGTGAEVRGTTGGTKDASSTGAQDYNAPTEANMAQLGIVAKISSKFEELGVLFGLSLNDIDNLKAGTNHATCRRIFASWIASGSPNYPATWKGLYDVLCDIQHKNTADDMKAKLAQRGIYF